MKDSSNSMSRRKALSGLIVLPALGALFASTATVAEAKGTKAQFKYQSHPNGGHKCAGCRFFHGGKTMSADGTCDVVAGAISPNGWCTAYNAK